MLETAFSRVGLANMKGTKPRFLAFRSSPELPRALQSSRGEKRREWELTPSVCQTRRSENSIVAGRTGEKKIVAGKGVGKKKGGGRGGGGRIFCDLESFLGCLGFRV